MKSLSHNNAVSCLCLFLIKHKHINFLSIKEPPPGRPELESILPDKDDIDCIIAHCLSQFSQMVSQKPKAREMADLLTRDEALSIVAYTCEHPYPLYRWLNAWLMSDRRDLMVVRSVGPFFQLFYRG